MDRTVIVEPSVFEDTLENVPIMQSLQTESVTKKWQQRQQEAQGLYAELFSFVCVF